MTVVYRAVVEDLRGDLAEHADAEFTAWLATKDSPAPGGQSAMFVPPAFAGDISGGIPGRRGAWGRRRGHPAESLARVGLGSSGSWS